MTISKALQDVLDERKRQVEELGWTLEHDDTHDNRELVDFALALLYSKSGLIDSPAYRRTLSKATALLVAEAERFDRAEVKAAKDKAATHTTPPWE